ncbi:MAG TPA: sensor histidine kinase [Saprospiraceae bacterium]|nr:sensor histidine kinase [Saprospiraceae bacterium]
MTPLYDLRYLMLIFSLFIFQNSFAQTAEQLQAKADRIKRSDPDSNLIYTSQALTILKSHPNDSLQLQVMLTRMDGFRFLGLNEELIDGIRICDSLNAIVNDKKAEVTINNLYGLYYWKAAQFDSAIQYFVKVREQALILKDTTGIIKSYNNIGNIFADVGQGQKARDEFLIGVKYALHKDSLGLFYLYNGLSSYYREKKQYDSAIIYIKHSLDIAEKLNNMIDVQRAASNMGATYFMMKEYGKAEENLVRAVKLAEEQYVPESLVKIYYHLAEVYIATKRFKLAEEYGNRVVDMATKENFIEDIKYGHEILYQNAKASGNMAEALAQHEMYIVYKDSIFDADHMARITEIETKYKTAQKDLELQKLSSDIEIMDRNKKLTQTRFIFISLGVLLFFLALYLNRSVREMQREKRRREEYTAGILFSREDERKGLSRELHDHVGQNLVLLNQSLMTGDINKSKQLTQEVLSDIRRVSRELYPWQIEKLGLDAALKDLITTTESLTDILLTYELDPLNEFADRDRSLQVYRIVQECLNNLIKHSRARSARITLHRTGDDMQLTVQDNGSGFDTKAQMNNTKSLGLMTMKDRIQSLKGKLEIESAEGKGSRFSFSFPAV